MTTLTSTAGSSFLSLFMYSKVLYMATACLFDATMIVYMYKITGFLC
jgi:hypothetical protein